MWSHPRERVGIAAHHERERPLLGRRRAPGDPGVQERNLTLRQLIMDADRRSGIRRGQIDDHLPNPGVR
jgi:hypothetical protein